MRTLYFCYLASSSFETDDKGHPGLSSINIHWFEPGTIDTVLGSGEDYAKLMEYTSDDGAVFGEAAGIVQSAALARIGPGGTLPAGLLALGSRTRGAFHGGQGTDLLIFLARVMENCLLRHSPAD